jgi:hypothetical protein
MSRTEPTRPGAPATRLAEAKKQIELASDDIDAPGDVCDLAEAMELIERVQESVEADRL